MKTGNSNHKKSNISIPFQNTCIINNKPLPTMIINVLTVMLLQRHFLVSSTATFLDVPDSMVVQVEF